MGRTVMNGAVEILKDGREVRLVASGFVLFGSGTKSIVEGKPGKSEVVKRISSASPAARLPRR